jgi:predicted DNA-binding transcriptional regulator YafY
MRKSTRLSPLKQTLTIMAYLAEHPSGATIYELMAATGFQRRTIYRYIAALNEAGIKIKNMVGRGQGIRAVLRMVSWPRWVR